MTALLHSLGDYMVLTTKKCIEIYKKYDHKIINKGKYIILAQRVVVVHNTAHYLV
jgi:hypothetical protein